MPRDINLQNQKKQEIITYFNKLSSVMDFGVKKYTIAYCTAATAQKFYLRPKTVETYIYR
jgi:predicted nucleic-acid-binding Zn-ribbon protein